MDELPLGTVSHIQNMLREISFFMEEVERVIPDGIFGQQTKDSVASFQRAHGLYVTGEVDNDTWDKIVEVYEKVVKDNKEVVEVFVFNESRRPINRGEHDPSLYVIQGMILALSEKFSNIGSLFVTGVFDEATADEVKNIQIISGITPNDKIDAEFVNALSELYNTYVSRNRVENARPAV